MDDPVLFRRDGHVATLILNRPAGRNVISSQEMVEAFVQVVARINADEEIRAVILSGAGSAFSAGGDVKEMAAAAEERAQRPYETRTWYRQGIQRIPRAIYGLEAPLIAAVNGPAIGAGCDLACMCDLRIAGASAVFAASFAHVGLIPGDGGAYFLSRVVGYTRAAEMIFTGKRVAAKLALEYGLVSRVTADERLMDEAMALAREIAAHPPHVLRMGKWLLREAQSLSLDTVLELSANMQAIAHTTPAHREAVAALLQKLRRR